MILDAKRFAKEISAGCQPVYRGRVDIVSGVMIEAAAHPRALELHRRTRDPEPHPARTAPTTGLPTTARPPWS